LKLKRQGPGRFSVYPWTEEEVEQLSLGVKKHGHGLWKKILDDPEFKFHEARTSINIKVRNI
jgi:hypothetical protein